MNSAARRGGVNDRDRLALAFAPICALGGVLIWVLWVLPIAASVDAADPHPIGETTVVELETGERVGVWGRGISANLGTMACAVTAPDGEAVATRGGPSLGWSDTLWWMTPRGGFAQSAQFIAPAAGAYRVSCMDSLETYDGDFLIAGDTFGSGSIGLGRNGGNDFAIGSLLAFGAVFLPPLAVLLPAVIGIRLAVTRRRSSRVAR
ncbi:hypothetical protein [Microbacterium saperdae]|uniref:Uncharacterized protein n=1 Tax=Microbacterium saperdae TaxID=69368 RepID=A0A543BPG1_9MICO|nr:hypothetical protein [Microbacterium saperdae]TQL86719.1 hypothetical protein FB560_2383 [Microbacterium saperdae]GGM45850.1 hypothetical protein GCM10010489_16310 [Microbacterium saperdae]